MANDQERAAFEALAKEQGWELDTYPGTAGAYVEPDTAAAWLAYRAALATAPVTCQTYGPGVTVPCAECNQTLVDSQELAERRERAAERERFPNLLPVIQWLERGCDPKEAAKELRIYQQMLAHNA